MQNKISAMLVVLVLAIAAASSAHAEGDVHEPSSSFPEKPVRMIVPLAPGGGSDIVARIISTALSEYWGQSVIVDNRPGAGTTVGTSIAAKASNDGYTLLVSSSSVAISPALYRKLDFDIRRDFDEVTLIASQPSILAVHPSVPAASATEFIALAKSHPGKFAYASAGPGSATHLGTELLKHAAGIDLLHVPYKSAGLAVTALLGNEAQVLMTNMASLLPHVKAGRVKALGITTPQRSPLAPEMPTLSEAAIPGFEYATWYGMLVPAGTPKTVIARIQADTAKVIARPAVHQRFSSQGLNALATPTAEFESFLNAEISRWDTVVRTARIRIE